ncbi:MAG: hypothetical protein RL095_1371 [Verrucomicrobiota bacterium]|jgi:tRNA(His) 5'-end guanylyltransferase
MKDEFGDRMKDYEGREAGRRFIPLLPVCARLDGRGFSKFTRGLRRPYDQRMSQLMIDTTLYLVKESGASVGYTQSDEISLAWDWQDRDAAVFFDGRIQKMVSVLAAMASSYFNREKDLRLPEKSGSLALFDCRAWQVPSLAEAANVFFWRETDATKNSVSMAARHYFSHAALNGKSWLEMKEMLRGEGVVWEEYPAFFKRGTYIRRVEKTCRFSAAEIESLPPKHAARTQPELEFTRAEIRTLEMPPFGSVQNRRQVLFDDAEAIVGPTLPKEDKAPRGKRKS